MSSYHDHKVALVVICYIATVSNHLWKQHPSAVHVQTPFFGTSFTLYIESVSCLWLWDCSLSLVQPKWGEWPLPSLGFLISHLGPDMFNRVHICLLTQWVVVPLLPLHLFFFAQKNGTYSKVTEWRSKRVLRKEVLAKWILDVKFPFFAVLCSEKMERSLEMTEKAV